MGRGWVALMSGLALVLGIAPARADSPEFPVVELAPPPEVGAPELPPPPPVAPPPVSLAPPPEPRLSTAPAPKRKPRIPRVSLGSSENLDAWWNDHQRRQAEKRAEAEALAQAREAARGPAQSRCNGPCMTGPRSGTVKVGLTPKFEGPLKVVFYSRGGCPR
jgi:hypothetical protein